MGRVSSSGRLSTGRGEGTWYFQPDLLSAGLLSGSVSPLSSSVSSVSGSDSEVSPQKLSSHPLPVSSRSFSRSVVYSGLLSTTKTEMEILPSSLSFSRKFLTLDMTETTPMVTKTRQITAKIHFCLLFIYIFPHQSACKTADRIIIRKNRLSVKLKKA